MALTTVQFARPVHSADASSDKVEARYDVEQDIVGLADAEAAVEEVEARFFRRRTPAGKSSFYACCLT